ncbi:hypothetical protein V501_02231 [Pseudogymnoascus sp. VKM F-4519 (FW-2642)]|nr:hypothetical protein V501_02231 [Pseudogymnoascus sp. VKM F-4519 (FW-2642)]
MIAVTGPRLLSSLASIPSHTNIPGEKPAPPEISSKGIKNEDDESNPSSGTNQHGSPLRAVHNQDGSLFVHPRDEGLPVPRQVIGHGDPPNQTLLENEDGSETKLMGADSQPPANLDDWLPTGKTGSLATGITDHTLSMFRAILAENGIADADEAILEQEMVMFFIFTRWHRIRLGRPGDFANCPMIIDAADDMSDVITKTIVPSISHSPAPSPPPFSPPRSPRPPTPAPSRHSLRGTSGSVENLGGMDGRHKKKRKCRAGWDFSTNAATLDPMSIAKGPHDGLTPQEKVAAFKFIQLAGIGTENTNEETRRRYRLWWKDLSDMKNAGVIELRAIAHAQGNYSGWLDRLQATEQLTISESRLAMSKQVSQTLKPIPASAACPGHFSCFAGQTATRKSPV